MKKAAILVCMAVLILFLSEPVFSSYRLDGNKLASEISGAGMKVLGTAECHGIPCLEIELPENKAIFEICRKVPTLNARYLEAREVIGVINGLNPFFPRSSQKRPFDTVKKTILIPLDTTVQPNAFPSFNQKFSNFERMILVSREKQLLAYYEKGSLVACLPVSTGRSGKGTPAMEGWVGLRDKNHVSSIYDVFMPFSLLLVRPYFVHAGVMPGMPDSAGCIRMFTEHAKWLFEKIGSQKTRFRVD